MRDPGKTPHRGRALLLCALVYAAATLLLCLPVVREIATAIPNDDADPVLNSWILWWDTQAVPLSAGWWDAPAFHPATGALAFSESLLGVAWLSAPVEWLSGNPQLAYNTAFLLSFWLSALSAHLLCRQVTGRHDAALIGGAAFGFAPYRIAHLAHLQVLSAWAMPIALLALHRYLADRRRRWLVLFAAGWLVQSLANGYYFFFFSLLVGLWLGWFAVPGGRWRSLPPVAAAWAAAALLMVPLLAGYQRIHGHYHLKRSIEEIHAFSADLTSLLDAAPKLMLWGRLHVFHRPEGELFPGLIVTALAGAGAVLGWRRRPTDRRLALHKVLAAAAAVFALSALSVAVFGPWRLDLGPLRIRITPVHRMLGRSLLCLAGAGLTSRTIRAAWRRGSPLGFYLGAAALSWLLALGPTVHFLGEPLPLPGPYALLMRLPGFDGLRVPARFAMCAVLCLAVAAAVAAGRSAGRGRLASAGLAVLAVAIAAEGWTARMPVAAPPEPCPLLADSSPDDVVLEVPIGDTRRDAQALYRAIRHHRRLVNGYSGYAPPHYLVLRLGLESADPTLLADLAARGVSLVYVKERRTNAWIRYVAAHPGATVVGTCPEGTVFRLPRAPAPAPAGKPASLGRRLPIAAVRANRNPDQTRWLRDGDLETRWTTGLQEGGEELRIDLGDVAEVGALELQLGASAYDYPRELSVEVSTDGDTWSERWHGSGATPAFEAALLEPVTAPMVLDLGGAPARFLRLRQVGSDPVYYWSVVELAVHLPAGR